MASPAATKHLAKRINDGEDSELKAPGSAARVSRRDLPGNQNGYVWIIEPVGADPFRKLIDLPAAVYRRGATWTRHGSSIILRASRSVGSDLP